MLGKLGEYVDGLGSRDLSRCPECGEPVNVNVTPEGTRFYCPSCESWLPTKEVIR